jgi:hypothetical protein
MTPDGNVNLGPIWSPDGRYIVYGTQEGLSWTRADGAGMPQPLIRTKRRAYAYSFTPDGKRLAYIELGPEKNRMAYGPCPRERRRGAAGRETRGLPANTV